MSPEIWGETGWNFIHFVTMGYPLDPTEQDKYNYYQYFHALQYVLPCKKCRYNLSHHLKKFPLTDQVLSSRNNLVKWGIDLHNVVNYYIGKPMLTYQQALNEINKKIKSSKSPNNNTFYYLLIIITLIVIIYLAYYYLTRRNKKLNY